jgi:arginase
MSPPPRPEEDLLLVFPQWQGAGDLPALRDSALALASRAFGTRRRVEVPVAPAHRLSRERGIEGRWELLAQLREARDLLEAHGPARILAVGGDCGIETPLIAHLNARWEGRLAVLWLDAHPDLNTPGTSPSGHFHGMPLRVLLGEGDPEFTALVPRPLLPEQIVLAGTRSFDPPEQELAGRRGLRRISPGRLEEDLPEIVRWIRETGAGRVHVHLDLDVCEPEELPTVACPTPGGVPVDALVRVLEAISGEVEVVGAAITEALFGEAPFPRALEPVLRWFRDLCRGRA